MLSSLQARLGATLMQRVAGDDLERQRQRIHVTPGERWFEAGSPIARVHGDASMFIGGIRAVLLQTMHPAAMTAVAEHSGYRGDMWGRLARTSRFIAVTTFGTAEHAQQAVDAVRRIHDRIDGVLADATPYSASDPHLLAWVHAAEIDSFLLAHQHYGHRPLTPAECDEYVAQTAVVATRLGVVDPPLTLAALKAELAAFEPELTAIDHARDAVSYLVWHPELPLVARPAYGVLMAAAIGLLPRSVRRELGLRSPLPVGERLVLRVLGGAATSTIRWGLAAIPPPTRE